ncbi:uncharacterized protein LOC120337818 isoform X2 [Styela clava]
MEWNRWHRGSILSKNDEKSKVQQMKNLQVISNNLDVAAAIHDQRILLETIMPNAVLEYYNKLADQNIEADADISSSQKTNCSSTVDPPEQGITNDNCEKIAQSMDSMSTESNMQSDLIPTESLTESIQQTELLDDVTLTSSLKEKQEMVPTYGTNGLSLGSRTENFLKYVGMIKKEDNHKDFSSSKHNHLTSSSRMQNDITSSNDSSTGCQSEPYNGLFSTNHSQQSLSSSELKKEKLVKEMGKSTFFDDIDNYIQEFASAAPDFLSLLDALDSDICVAIDVVDHLVNEVVKQVDGNNHNVNHDLPVIIWRDDTISQSMASDTENKCYELRKSISELLQEFGVVCDLTIGSSSSSTAEERRAIRKAERRKRRSWLYKNPESSSSGKMTSWGWMPRKEVKDVSTDTSDLAVDMSNMEWLSPEAFLSKDDLVFRLFSIIGASYRGYAAMHEKQIAPFIADSSCQTVAPFLLHIDMNAIGRALSSASLSSSVQNLEERRQMLALLTDGKSSDNETSGGSSVKLNENLMFNNLSLGSVMESVPRYQTKPHSMYSFMCGCLLRRDQFASHIQNTHCEIMSGLNGWIEQKCPYAAYGCNYTQPRFCPDHHTNAIVFNQSQNAFTVRPGLWSTSETEDNAKDQFEDPLHFLNLPYEVHEKLFNFLDCFTINQLSLTCSYMREVCKNHLASRGIVEVKWFKRTYEDGTQSWKMGDKIWSFPTAFTKINRWVLPDNLPMVEHVSKCPVIAACDLKYKEERVKVFY